MKHKSNIESLIKSLIEQEKIEFLNHQKQGSHQSHQSHKSPAKSSKHRSK